MRKSVQIPYGEDFEERIKSIKHIGFDCVDIDFESNKTMSEDEWKKASRNINRILEKADIKCTQTHLPYYFLGLSSEIIDNSEEKRIINAIDISAEIDAEWCVCHPRTSITTNYNVSSSLKDNYNSISKYICRAKKKGTKIAIENMPEFPLLTNPRMPFYTSDYRDLITLRDSFNDEDVGICWDFGHAGLMKWELAQKGDFSQELLMRYGQENAIKEVGNRIKCTHIHNNFLLDDHHLSPDLGKINWNKVIKVFKETGYSGALSLELNLSHCVNKELFLGYMTHCYEAVSYLENLMEDKNEE